MSSARAWTTPGLRVLAITGILVWLFPSTVLARTPPSEWQETVASILQPQRDTGSATFLDPVQEVLVELRIGRVARRTVEALERDGTALLPVGELLELGEVRFALEEDGTLRAVRYPADRIAVVSPARGEASLNGTDVPMDPGWVEWDGETLFVAVPLLEVLFDLTMRVDWSFLTVTVLDAEALPLGRRLAREARWRALGAPGLSDPADLYLGLERRSVGGMVADWSLNTVMDDPTGTASYRVGAAGQIMGGSLRVTSRSLGPMSGGEHRVDATYQIVRRESPYLTQIQVGDGLSTGPRTRSIRGIALTNAPFVRSGFFGVDLYSGRVGPGWEVELRQAGRTLDVSRADEQGAYALDIPVRYGDNPVQVVAFGPHGEVVTTERLMILDRERLPAGRFEWGLSAGECRSLVCDGTGNLDLRYGISSRWTVRAGADGFARDSLPDLLHPYVGVAGALTSSVQVGFEGVARGLARGTGTWTPSQHLRLRAAHTVFDTGVDAPILHSSLRRFTSEADLFIRPLRSHDRWFLQGSVVRQRLTTGSVSRWQALNSLQLRNLRVDGGVRRESTVGVGGVRTTEDFQQAAVTGMVPVGGTRRVWMRAEAETLELSRLSRVRARAGYQVTRDARLELGGGWSRLLGHDVTVSFTAHLSQLRSVTQLFSPEGGDSRVTQLTQGTIQWNEATGGMAFGSGPGLTRGGISGYVFVDENGNGVLDPGEPVLEGVRVVLGGQTIRTDSRGRFQMWDLVPFEPVRIRVDSGSLPDPTLVPSLGSVEVEVPPASYRRVDLPLSPSGEVSGRAVRVDGGGRELPVGNLELELVDKGRGTIRTITTFSDGEIYLHGIPPGTYELRVSREPLRNTGWAPETALTFTMPLDAARMSVSGLLIRLIPE